MEKKTEKLKEEIRSFFSIEMEILIPSELIKEEGIIILIMEYLTDNSHRLFIKDINIFKIYTKKSKYEFIMNSEQLKKYIEKKFIFANKCWIKYQITNHTNEIDFLLLSSKMKKQIKYICTNINTKINPEIGLENLKNLNSLSLDDNIFMTNIL